MATQKQVISYTSSTITQTLTNYTLFTCPANKIAKIEFNFANFYAPDSTVSYNMYAQLCIKPSGSVVERDFAYIYGGSNSNGYGYTLFPTTEDKANRRQYATASTNLYLFQGNQDGENTFATAEEMTNYILFPSEVYLNSGDALIVKLDSNNAGTNYTFYLNGLILTEDSDA